MNDYRTIVGSFQSETEEKKSRFIGQLYPVRNEEEAKELLMRIKKKYRDANHSCSAYIIEGTQILERYSDDGEPAGTAGMPILEVLRGRELKNILAVVTRYFGGTKLGTGGLVRAYTKATQEVLKEAEVVEKGLYIRYTLTVPYTLSGKVDYHIQTESLLVEATDYADGVIYRMAVTSSVYEAVCSRFIELCNNQCSIEKIEEVVGYVSSEGFVEGI